MEVIGPGYMWIFTDSISADDFTKLSVDQQKAVSGSFHILPNGGSAEGFSGWVNMTNFFKTSPRGEADRARTNQLLPPNDIDPDFNFSITKTEWEDVEFDVGGYTYDSVIAMGLSMCKAQSKESSAVFEALKSISFEGVSGTVAFNEYGTRAADTALAIIANIRYVNGGIEYEQVGQTKGGKWDLTSDNFVYSDGSKKSPHDVTIPFHNFNFLDSSFRGAGYFCFTVVILLCVMALVWTLRNRDSVVVKSSQWHFLALICFGTMGSISCILPYSVDDDHSTKSKKWMNISDKELSTECLPRFERGFRNGQYLELYDCRVAFLCRLYSVPWCALCKDLQSLAHLQQQKNDQT